MLILASFSLVVGSLSLLNPFFLGESRNLVIGIMLVIEAVLDITTYFLLKHALKKLNAGQTVEVSPQASPADSSASSPTEPESVPSQPEQTPSETKD